jgi:hypothetical protein
VSRLRSAALVLAVCTSAVLAACSDGSDEGSGASSTTAVADPTSSTTEPPTFTGDAGSPFCTLLRDVDPTSLLDGDPGDPAAVEAGFRRLVDVLREVHALAPPEIEADAALVTGGIEALDEALAAVGYDFDALAASPASAEVTAAVNDPAFTSAGNRLSAYRTQVCQL